jgi:transposase-like protein
MKASVKVIRKQRVFSESYQRELVGLFEQGKFSVLQLSRLYGITNAVIYRWIYKYSKFNEPGYRVIEMKESSTSKLQQMEQRIRELEKIVGQKQIKIDFLEEMILVAKEELKIDIKKKSFTPPSGVSKKEKKN